MGHMLGNMTDMNGNGENGTPKATTKAADKAADKAAARARWTIIGTVAAAIVVFLALGFAVSWGLAAIFAIIMIPGAISVAIIAHHPERTGGRSMLGISDPSTLLDPITGGREHPRK
ncbi:hypothetical protein BW13_07920 [Bifidobacterium sp. UTCIF-37]|nr:hypothetical protein BW13_07920 [Bifidobacterium sp. UTCIF-37]TPF89262.1 hypothetical protein BW11_05605 [Bifidobacterium sp. UTCIF-38]